MTEKRIFKSVLVLMTGAVITSAVVGATFAKYVTVSRSRDSARVAYWGFTSPDSIELAGLFGSSYVNSEDIETVKAENNDNIIAPGTAGSQTFYYEYDETGAEAPEVDYVLNVDLTGSHIDDALKANDQIEWKLDDGEWSSYDNMMSNILQLSGDMSASYDGAANVSSSKTYKAGTLPAAFGKDDTEHTVYWRWNFTDPSNTELQDAKDTALGNAAEAARCSIAVSVSAVQVD